MAVIDVHVHIYPDKIAERATSSISRFYNIEMDVSEGSVDRLLGIVRDTPITDCVVHSVAVRASNVESINDFIAKTCAEHSHFIGFNGIKCPG